MLNNKGFLPGNFYTKLSLGDEDSKDLATKCLLSNMPPNDRISSLCIGLPLD